jgi:hypothetical protein
MSSPFAARIEHQLDGSLRLTFRFKAEAVADIKFLIPANCREYSPDEKAWYVNFSCHAIALDILRFHFGTVDVINGPAPTPIRKSDPDFAALHLLPTAPGFLVEAVYRAMARRHHPDHGGDVEAMKAVNAAYKQIRNRGAA